MTDPITTPQEALEAAERAVAETDIGYHDGISGDWHPYAGPTIISKACAAIRALSARIAALSARIAAPDLEAVRAEAVAGAYAAAADLMGELAGQHKGNTAEIIKACGRAILMRKLTPADAAAALARRDAEVREAALRGAVAALRADGRHIAANDLQALIGGQHD